MSSIQSASSSSPAAVPEKPQPQTDAGLHFKMPGVDVKGLSPSDPAIHKSFEVFDKPMPSLDLQWPEKGEWLKSTCKDGSLRREWIDAAGNRFRETVDSKGTKEREVTAKNGDRRYKITNTNGFVMRGGSDTCGNSWSVDSNGFTTRTYTDSAGTMFNEYLSLGVRTREMMDRQGNYFTEKLYADGRLERQTSDADGNNRIEARDGDSWMKGFGDNKGNRYSIDSHGTSIRIHQDENDVLYSESTGPDGIRTRQIIDERGNLHIERQDSKGISRTMEMVYS